MKLTSFDSWFLPWHCQKMHHTAWGLVQEFASQTLPTWNAAPKKAQGRVCFRWCWNLIKLILTASGKIVLQSRESVQLEHHEYHCTELKNHQSLPVYPSPETYHWPCCRWRQRKDHQHNQCKSQPVDAANTSRLRQWAEEVWNREDLCMVQLCHSRCHFCREDGVHRQHYHPIGPCTSTELRCSSFAPQSIWWFEDASNKATRFVYWSTVFS